MTNRYVSSAQYSNVTAWTSSTAIGTNQYRRQVSPNLGSERVFFTSAGGTTGTTEPTWNLSKGGSTTDGSVTWIEATGVEANQVSGTWKAPYARLGSALTLYVATAAVASGGTGNAVNDVLTGVGNTPYGDQFKLLVTSVSSGVVTGISILSGGSYQPIMSTISGVTTTSSGSGSGATFNITTSQNSATGDLYLVGNDHAETQASALTLVFPGLVATPNQVLGVNVSGAVPPGSGDLSSGHTPSIKTTGASALLMAGAVGWGPVNTNLTTGGLTILAGSGTSTAYWGFTATGSTGATMNFRNCLIGLNNSSTSSLFFSNTGFTAASIVLDNTQVQFGATAQGFSSTEWKVLWKNTVSAIQGTTPAQIIKNPTYCDFTARGVDLSAIGSGSVLVQSSTMNTIRFINCRLGAGVTALPGLLTTQLNGRVSIQNCDDSTNGRNYRLEEYAFAGSHVQDSSVVRTGGASNGTTPESWKITTGSALTVPVAFDCIPISRFFPNPYGGESLGTSTTVTIAGIANAAAVPNNDQIWLEVEALTTSGIPITSFTNNAKQGTLATASAVPTDTSAWDTAATARANSTVYTVGQTYRAASNVGRVFFCTTGGTSNATEPTGIATAVDGSSVTDGTAVFRAGCRFALSVTVTPQLAGYLHATVKVANPSSTYYIDPRMQPA